jgi:uncharacterized phage protein (TIGR02216 family)
VIALGLGRLRWSPRELWAATPREIAAAVRALTGSGAGEPATRADLERLIAAFPDGGA